MAGAIHGREYRSMENEVNSFLAIYGAYKAARRGKLDNPTAMKFRMDALARSASLAARLQARTYTFGPYYPFMVYEPKEREVLAVDFEGKTVQHSLCDNLLYPYFTRSLIRDNYAGQIGKGTLDGLDRLAAMLRHYFFSRKAADEKARREAGLPYRPMEEWDYADGWVLKGDFYHFFYSLCHDLCKWATRYALRPLQGLEVFDFALWLMDMIIDSTPDPGIAIGNQSSQLLGVRVLDPMDHWLTDDLGDDYGRYMDDFFDIHESKETLQQRLHDITVYADSIGLRLNGKTQIFPLKNGIDFLGFHTYLTHTGKVVRKVRASNIDTTRRRIRKYRRLVDAGKMTLDAVAQSYQSWRAHVEHGNSYHLLQRMDEYFFSYFPELRHHKILTPKRRQKTNGQDPRKPAE